MSYKLRFHELALAEWRMLYACVREPFRKKLAERLLQPRVPADALHGMADCYKIKLRTAGCRLVYRVDGTVVYVTVIAIGKRERNRVYAAAKDRLD